MYYVMINTESSGPDYKRPGRKDMRFGSAISLSLSLPLSPLSNSYLGGYLHFIPHSAYKFALQKYLCSFINFYMIGNNIFVI
jgi:hypothetical protein